MAQYQLYLRLEGVDGEEPIGESQKMILIASYSHGLSMPVAPTRPSLGEDAAFRRSYCRHGLFTVTNLPSYRLVIDMTDLDGARIVITTGQSGHPFDRHYTDQIDAWRTGGTLPLPFTEAAIGAATVATLTLEPRGAP